MITIFKYFVFTHQVLVGQEKEQLQKREEEEDDDDPVEESDGIVEGLCLLWSGSNRSGQQLLPLRDLLN